MKDTIIVVPCYNEEARLAVDEFIGFADAHPDLGFLFVNDGSTDGTSEVIQRMCSHDRSAFQSLTIENNVGKGEAVRVGLRRSLEAAPTMLGYWDADLATPLGVIPEFTAILDAHPSLVAVLGSRVTLLGRKVERSRWRKLASRSCATIASILLRFPVKDTQCGAKMFRNCEELAISLSKPFQSRWIFDVELLFRLSSAIGGPMVAQKRLWEQPLTYWREVPESKVRATSIICSALELGLLVAGRMAAPRGTLQKPSSKTDKPRLGSGYRKSVRALGSQGFTLIELVCVIAIIAILVALVLPAVQAARESARSSQCKSNLRQLGVALHCYHDVHRCLPISMGPWRGTLPEPKSLNGKGWMVGILPQLEQESLYQQFTESFPGDFFSDGGLRSPKGRSAMQTQLAIIQCPSDASVRGHSADQFQWEDIPVALTSYKGVIGDTRVGGHLSSHGGSLPDCHAIGGCNGLFFRMNYREPQRLSFIVDGVSNTLMVGEDVPEHNAHSAAFYSNGDWASCNAPLNFFPKTPTPRAWALVMSFRSRHPGGAHFCYSDGAVRFVAQSIDETVYRALSTKNGREAATPPD